MNTFKLTKITKSIRSGSLLFLMGMSAPLLAQEAVNNAAENTEEEVERIVVTTTGSSIRGVAPTGSPIVSVERTDIEQVAATTTTELLRSVPQMGSFNTTGGKNGSDQANFNDQPAIHGIGVGNGGGGLTLVLFNGFRLPGSGINQTAPDPSSIPASAVKRVEIVADGASSIYGSDAVAGVVNFITRDDFEGFEVAARTGFGDGYETYNASALYGTAWDSGNFVLNYEYSGNTELSGLERDYFKDNQLENGDGDNRTTICSPANVLVDDTNYAISGESAVAGKTNKCEGNKANSLYPEQNRHQGYFSLTQDVSDTVQFFTQGIYSKRTVKSEEGVVAASNSTGGLVVDVTSGAGYDYAVNTLGIPAGTHSVTYNPENDFGASFTNDITTETISIQAGVKFEIGDEWEGTVAGNYGREDDYIAQNGMNQGLAVSAAASGLLNPYGVGPANDSTLIEQIGDYATVYKGEQTVQELQLKFDGPVMEITGGEIMAAVGASYREETFDATTWTGAASDSTKPITSSKGKRDISSVYAELFIPLVGADNEMTGMEIFELALSGRYDDHDDVGSTFNPKVGINWAIISDLEINASYGTSFHAPSLADAGTAIDTRAIRFPGFFAGDFDPDGYTAILAGGNDLEPEEATTYSLGINWTPSFADGLVLTANYFNIEYENVITFPGFEVVTEASNPIYDPYRVYSPTEEQTLAALEGFRHDGLLYPDVDNLPAAIYDLRRQNFATQFIEGVDFSATYTFAVGSGDMVLSAAGTYMSKFDQQINGSDVTTSRLNTYYAQDLKVRSTIGWTTDNISAMAFINYTSDFVNTTNDKKVDSFTTVDLHFGYTFSNLGDLQVALDVNNLVDEEPPYYYVNEVDTRGFHPSTASPLGRVISLGVRKSF